MVQKDQIEVDINLNSQ